MCWGPPPGVVLRTNPGLREVSPTGNYSAGENSGSTGEVSGKLRSEGPEASIGGDAGPRRLASERRLTIVEQVFKLVLRRRWAALDGLGTPTHDC